MLICLNAVAECGQSEREKMENCMMELTKGNTDAMEPLYRIANPSVYAFALSLLKNSYDAEEIAQECFVRAYLGAAGYKPQGKPMAWLITITRNLCMEKLRERGKRSDIPEEDWDKYFQQTAASPEDRMVLEQCMKALDDSERQVVILHAVGGMKHRETAELMGLPLATVLSKYSRAIKKLKSKLEKREGI